MKFPKSSWITPRVEIRDSKIHGKGMFAKEPIKKGETVVVWGGEYVNKEESEKLKKEPNSVIIQVGDDLFCVEKEGEETKDLTYFMNHSCDPNIWMKDAVILTSRRDIKPGEELTIDYALWIDDILVGGKKYSIKWICECNSPLCRKKITGKDWMLPELQRRYKGRFSPLINKRIDRLK